MNRHIQNCYSLIYIVQTYFKGKLSLVLLLKYLNIQILIKLAFIFYNTSVSIQHDVIFTCISSDSLGVYIIAVDFFSPEKKRFCRLFYCSARVLQYASFLLLINVFLLYSLIMCSRNTNHLINFRLINN
jgi:hypothetical protein